MNSYLQQRWKDCLSASKEKRSDAKKLLKGFGEGGVYSLSSMTRLHYCPELMQATKEGLRGKKYCQKATRGKAKQFTSIRGLPLSPFVAVGGWENRTDIVGGTKMTGKVMGGGSLSPERTRKSP